MPRGFIAVALCVALAACGGGSSSSGSSGSGTKQGGRVVYGEPTPFPVNLYTALRYNLIRHSSEVMAVKERAAIGVPPRQPKAPAPVAQQGLISMASHTTSPVSVDRK